MFFPDSDAWYRKTGEAGTSDNVREKTMKRDLTRVLSAVLAAAAFMVGLALPACAAPAQKSLILATTTSTQDSGLLDILNPLFEKKTGYFVKTISVGSGQAMAMGRKGEADLLLVHSPEAEKKFMAEGFGVDRLLVMHNDYVVLGPSVDPAAIKVAKTTPEAFRKIAAAGALFLSRGDNSGTHAKEKGVWKAAGISPAGQKWYQETGLGMGQTLNVANEKNGYLIADRGTYLALKRNLSLAILKEGDPILLNIYHVIGVNPGKWPKVNTAGAKAFSDFMVSPEIQGIIKTYGVDKYGSPLFFPDAGKREDELGR